MVKGIKDLKLAQLLEENLRQKDEELSNTLQYTKDDLQEANKENLLKLVSNLDKSIFFFKNQGILTGAFGSKYSRTSENMRPVIQKLMNEESKNSEGFKQLNIPDDVNLFGYDFFDRVYSEYGDDSIAQMVPLTVGFEQISMLYAMSLFHHRLLAGIEKSTRYKEFDKKINNKYQYYTPNEFEKVGLKEEFEKITNNLFDVYSQAINKKKDIGKKVYDALTQKILPKEIFRSEVEKAVKERGWDSATDEELDKAYDKTIRAMHIDNVRHILPLATRTSLALQLNAQSLREVIMSSYATPTTESVVLSEILRREGEKFVGPLIKDLNLLSKDEKDRQRAEDYINFKHETGKVGIENYKNEVLNNYTLVREGLDKEFGFELKAYSFEERPQSFVTKENREDHFVHVKDLNSNFEANIALKVSLNEIVKSILKEGNPSASYADIEKYVRHLSTDERKNIALEYAGITNGLRKNRRHKPGRAFENANFDISIKIPVGEIRDLRRHRILTLYDSGFFDNNLGYYISPALKIAGCEEIVKKAYEEAGKFYEKASKETNQFVASYVLPFATYSWMNMTVNLRELHHMLELRTQPGAHGNYKKICQMIYAGLKTRAPFIGETMIFVDKSTEIDYGRALQELRTFRKQKK